MAQFFAYENMSSTTRARYPCLLDIQSDLPDGLRRTIVVPLAPSNAVRRTTISRLNPVMMINDEAYAAVVQEMAGIRLGPEVCDLSQHRSDVIAAIDVVFSGIQGIQSIVTLSESARHRRPCAAHRRAIC